MHMQNSLIAFSRSGSRSVRTTFPICVGEELKISVFNLSKMVIIFSFSQVLSTDDPYIRYDTSEPPQWYDTGPIFSKMGYVGIDRIPLNRGCSGVLYVSGRNDSQAPQFEYFNINAALCSHTVYRKYCSMIHINESGKAGWRSQYFTVTCRITQRPQQNTRMLLAGHCLANCLCPLRGDIRKNWNDTEKISMAPAQGWHAFPEW